MAYQIAQAYDENKNLVPLYVLTDGEVPEVSPGFEMLVVSSEWGNIEVSIVSNSTNPTGGVITDSTPISIRANGDINITVYNNSEFNIVVSMSFENTKFAIDTGNPSTIASGSSAQFSGQSGIAGTASSTLKCAVQRIRT